MALIDSFKNKLNAGGVTKPLVPTAPVPKAPISSSLAGSINSAIAGASPAMNKKPVPTAPLGVGATMNTNPGIGTAVKMNPAPTSPVQPAPTTGTTVGGATGGKGAGIFDAIDMAQTNKIQPAPITNAALGGAAPATGYGGATYGSSGDANKAISANQSKLASDPAFKDAETQRTLAVIAERKAQGLDTSQQEKYLKINLGYNPNQGQPAQTQGTVTNENANNNVAFSGNTNPNYNNYGQYVPGNTAAPPSWVTAEEQTWLDNQIAGMQGLSDTYRGQLNSALGENDRYIAGQIDAAQQMQNRRGGLYSGGYDYQAGTLTSEGLRRQADLQNQYGNQISSIAEQINNLQQAQPDILRQRIQEYINNDRNYALNYANTFGNLGGVNTQSMQNQLYNQDMTNQQFGWQKQMDEAGLTGMYNGASTLAGKQANWNAYMDMVNQTGQLGRGPAQNWSNLYNNAFAGGQTMGGQQNASSLVSQQQDRDLAPRQTALQEWAQSGYATPNVSAILGVPVGTPTNDASYRQIQNQLDQDKFTYSQWQDAAQAQNQQGQGQTISAATAGDMLSGSLREQVGTNNNDEPIYGATTNTTKREQAFVDLYNNYGIRGNDMITALTKAGYSMDEINKLKSNPHYQSVFQ